MTVIKLDPGTVIGGIDTHADTIHVAVIDPWGREHDDQEFATTPAGYRDALAFLTAHGQVAGIGIEGTSSYGIGIARAAVDAGLEVFEVTRPERNVRRRLGKSDPLDAYQAAHAVLAGRATSAAKTGEITALRALHNSRRPRSRRVRPRRSRSASSSSPPRSGSGRSTATSPSAD